MKEAGKELALTDAERKKQYFRDYYRKNKEKRNMQAKAWAAANPEKKREASRKWAAKPGSAELAKQRRVAYKRNNAERIKARDALAYQSQKAERAVAARILYERNRERRIKQAKEWAAKNRQKVNVISANAQHRRRAQKAATDNQATTAQLKSLKDSAKACHYCGRSRIKLTFDHVMPLSKGGSHTIKNIVMACGKCNSRKNAKTPEQWAKEIGMLLLV